MTDVLYGRQLGHNSHLLWASDDLTPDTGGGSGSGSGTGTDQLALWSDPLAEPIVNVSGAHRTVCVELDVSILILYIFCVYIVIIYNPVCHTVDINIYNRIIHILLTYAYYSGIRHRYRSHIKRRITRCRHRTYYLKHLL